MLTRDSASLQQLLADLNAALKDLSDQKLIKITEQVAHHYEELALKANLHPENPALLNAVADHIEQLTAVIKSFNTQNSDPSTALAALERSSKNLGKKIDKLPHIVMRKEVESTGVVLTGFGIFAFVAGTILGAVGFILGGPVAALVGPFGLWPAGIGFISVGYECRKKPAKNQSSIYIDQDYAPLQKTVEQLQNLHQSKVKEEQATTRRLAQNTPSSLARNSCFGASLRKQELDSSSIEICKLVTPSLR